MNCHYQNHGSDYAHTHYVRLDLQPTAYRPQSSASLWDASKLA